MEDLGLEPKDLVAAIEDKGTVSKVLNNRPYRKQDGGGLKFYHY